MDGSDPKSNFSPPISSNRRPLIPKSIDENGKSYKEKNKRSKKNHFGSWMISANSKSNLSRKKVLAETNESLDNQQKTPNLDSKCDKKKSNFDPNSKSGEIGGNSRPYDPSTNYLSPRPKFLLYNPKRHREIMLRKEKEGEIDSESPNSDLDSVSSCGSLPRLEGGEVDESDDEFEEEEDERTWGFSGALRNTFRVLMLLLVLVLSTSYIVSMNSPTPSPVVQAVVDLRDGYQILQNYVCGYVNQNLGLFRVMEDKRVFDMEIEEPSIEFSEEVEDEEIVELECGEIQDFSNSKAEENEEQEKVSDLDVEDIVELDGEIQDFSDSEMAERVEENEEEISVISNSEMLEPVSVSDNSGEIRDVSNSEVAKKADKGEDSGLNVREVSDFRNSEMLEAAVVQEKILIENSTDSQKFGDEWGSNLIKRFTEHIETESNLKAAVIGLSVVWSAAIASVLLVLKLSKSKNGVALPQFEARVPDMEEKPSESAANVFISTPFINSVEETPKEMSKSERFYQSLSNESRVTPIIELLGELEISEMSTSLRGCGLKNTRATGTEVCSKLQVDVKTPAPSQISSAFNYPSNSDGKKSTRKKGNEGLDQSRGKNELTTGLRRSSRIRNRVTSP